MTVCGVSDPLHTRLSDSWNMGLPWTNVRHAHDIAAAGASCSSSCHHSLRHIVISGMQGVALIVPWWVQRAVPWAVAFITGGTASERPCVKPH